MTRKSHSVTEYTIYLRKNWILIIVFAIAFLVRLIGLNQSLWIDEATTAKVVHSFNYLSILTKFSPGDFHPPLYYWTMKLWTQFFGYSEISLRMPSIIFSLIAGVFIYKSVCLLSNKTTALWATVFFLFNPLIIYYSQEARMYMMATFLLTISYYFLLKAVKSQKLQKDIFLSIGFALIAFVTYYGSAFFMLAVVLYLLFKKKYKFFILFLVAWLITIAIISPLLFQQLENSKSMLQSVQNWSLVLGKASVKNLLLIPIKFASGRISFTPKLFYYTLSGLWALITFYFAFLGFKKSLLLTSLFVGTLFLGFVFSLFVPLFDYFRFLFLIPFLAIALAIGSKSRFIRVGLATGFILWSLAYLLNPQMYREDWKSLVRNLPSHSIVYALPTAFDPINYYQSTIKTNDIRTTFPTAKEITVIPYASPIYGFNYQAKLSKLTYHLQKTANYRGGLSIEYWTKNL